ncbi:hypothetical protein BUALT_Bualt13G0090800 [Buddleja alternifolia]|uniref:Plastocyanin-like domain-containing protein n=1 Tax=Buddleja alternifolia TaxID=168488 RepID=A0AAV6WN11_9LAMI|nr:hypothetical protein BUALT_Bualt13G0090800 [Buddleja alternifolia]
MPGKTYLLRIINAAWNEELFFKIADHKMRVVEVDASYLKPFDTDTILVAPCQTTIALLTAHFTTGRYRIVASPFMDSSVEVDSRTATSVLHYTGMLPSTSTTLVDPPPRNATQIARKLMQSLRRLNSIKYPCTVPIKVDHSLLFTVSLGLNKCATCANGYHVIADINNVTFDMPKILLLNAHFFNISGVFADDFPRNPPVSYDYTGSVGHVEYSP